MSLSNPSLDFQYPGEYVPNDDEPLELHPEILMHPNIPKPLHGVNPRTIMGQNAWDKLRKEVYASTSYRCIACGVHQSQAKGPKWLEAHEFYKIDYGAGRVEIEKIIPLCHYCHNFIHSGRLQMIEGKEKDKDEIIEILEHGFKILADNNLPAFYGTLQVASYFDANTYGVTAATVPDGEVPNWGDWRLIWDGEEYEPIYKTYEQWKNRYLDE